MNTRDMVQRTEGYGEVWCVNIGKNALEGRHKEDIYNQNILTMLDTNIEYLNSRKSLRSFFPCFMEFHKFF